MSGRSADTGEPRSSFRLSPRLEVAVNNTTAEPQAVGSLNEPLFVLENLETGAQEFTHGENHPGSPAKRLIGRPA